jgi:hypothetical protein
MKAETQPHSVPFTSNAAALTNARRTLTEPPISSGETKSPNDLFMRQVGRTLMAADEGVPVGHRMLICDRDAKWSAPVRERLGEAGIRVVQTPYQAPNANAYAERFVRSIKDECLSRVIPLGRRGSRFDSSASPERHYRAVHWNLSATARRNLLLFAREPTPP